MGWFNYYGLAVILLIMVANILCAAFDKEAFNGICKDKQLNLTEQIGRYGCFVLMIFNIPYTYLGFWFTGALTVYLTVCGALIAIYCIGWTVFWKKRSLLRAVWLSVTPSVIFLFCGIIIVNIPLIVFSVIFSVAHITLSCRNCNNNK